MYRAILFSTDGDFVSDYHGCHTVEEVQGKIANQGSKWLFYPITCVIADYESSFGFRYTTSRQRIIDAPEEYKFLEGRTIHTVARYLRGELTLCSECGRFNPS